MNAWLTPAPHLPSAVLPQEERGGRRGEDEAHSKVLRGSFTFSAEGGRSIGKLSVYAALPLGLISVKEQVNCTDVPARPLPPSPPLLPCPYFVGGSFSRPQSCRNCPSLARWNFLPQILDGVFLGGSVIHNVMSGSRGGLDSAGKLAGCRVNDDYRCSTTREKLAWKESSRHRPLPRATYRSDIAL